MVLKCLILKFWNKKYRVFFHTETFLHLGFEFQLGKIKQLASSE